MYLKWTLTRIPTIFGQNSAAAGEAGVFCVSGVERPGAGKTGMPGIRALAIRYPATCECDEREADFALLFRRPF